MAVFRSLGPKNASRVPSNGKPYKNLAVDQTDGTDGARLSALTAALHDGRLRKILQMIRSHPSRKIPDLAIECNLSPSHLQHLFKQCTGFGLGQLLTEQRMQLAIDSLTRTNLSIKEIASAVGYEHTSSFTRAFERHFRQSPSYYRQAQGSSSNSRILD